MSKASGGGATVTAANLRQLLLARPAYRRLWERKVRRSSGRDPNAAAVARVIAEYLWDAGLHSDTDVELPRQLRYRVERALEGTWLSAETLEWFIEAFGMHADEDRLWISFSGLDSESVLDGPMLSGRLRNPPNLVLPQLHRTVAVFERYHINAMAELTEHHASQIIVAMEDGLEHFAYVFGDHAREVEVISGGHLGAVHRYGRRLKVAEIRLDRPLRRGERQALEYRALYPTTGAYISEVRRTVRNRTENLDLRVSFSPGRRPADIRWTVWSSPEDGEILAEEPAEDNGGDADAVHRFLPLATETVVGFRWSWP